MTRANGEYIIVNDDIGVYGFMFSPDFDTSQSMYISRFMKNFYRNENKVVKTTFDFDGLSIPLLLMGTDVESCLNELDEIVRPKISFSYAKKDIENIEEMKSTSFGKEFVKRTLDGKEYYVCTKDNFFVYVYDERCIAFLLNPYVYICEENEIMQNKKYIDGYMRLKGHKCYATSYLANMDTRRAALLKEYDNIFSKFEKMANENNFVVGSGTIYFNTGHLVLVGTKEDSDTCLKRKLFPYSSDKNILTRKTKEELDAIEKEKNDYENKCLIVDKRLDTIESLLESNGYRWTVISRSNIQFDENDNYSVWMNAQVTEDAHHGWYKEQDFIDWLNMEGPIPFHRAKVKYFSRMLQRVSNGKYEFMWATPIANKKNFSLYDDYEAIGVFRVDGKKRTRKITLEEIKSLIETYEPIKTFTVEDIENNIKKDTENHTKLSFINKIKNKIKKVAN